MISEGTKLIIKYRYFTDKDLLYILYLVREEFNYELANALDWAPATPYQKLQAPLEITEIKTGDSVFLGFNPSIEFIEEYLTTIGFALLIEILREIGKDRVKEMLERAISKSIERFKIRRRKDHLADLSTTASENQ